MLLEGREGAWAKGVEVTIEGPVIQRVGDMFKEKKGGGADGGTQGQGTSRAAGAGLSLNGKESGRKSGCCRFGCNFRQLQNT